MTEAGRPQLPIGYWLKQVDTLLTEQINQAHHTSGVSRFEWQLLHSLHQQGPLARASLLDTLQAFVDAPTLDLMLGRLQARGWIAKQAESARWHLTEEGEQHRAALFITQQAVRARAMQGISEADYATVLRVLQQMASNLEATPEG